MKVEIKDVVTLHAEQFQQALEWALQHEKDADKYKIMLGISAELGRFLFAFNPPKPSRPHVSLGVLESAAEIGATTGMHPNAVSKRASNADIYPLWWLRKKALFNHEKFGGRPHFNVGKLRRKR